MYLKFSFLILFLFSTNILLSQTESDISLVDEIGFYFFTPSRIPFHSSRELVAECSFPYGLKELSTKNIKLIIPFSTIGFSLDWENFGEKLYRENIVSGNVACKISGKFSVGLSGKIKSIEIERYPSIKEKAINCGFSYLAMKKIFVDIKFENLMAPKKRILPPRTLLGIKYCLYDNYILKTGICKEKEFTLNYFLENTLIVKNRLFLLFGASRNPDVLMGGLNIKIDNYCLGYILRDHAFLGLTHSFCFSYSNF